MHVYRKEANSLTVLQTSLEKSINSMTLQTERIREGKSTNHTILTSFDEMKNNQKVNNEEDFVPTPDFQLFHTSPKKKKSKTQTLFKSESSSKESTVPLYPNTNPLNLSLCNNSETNEVSNHPCDVELSSSFLSPSSPSIHCRKRKFTESTEESKLPQEKRLKVDCEQSPTATNDNKLNVFQFSKPSKPFRLFSFINSSWIQKNPVSLKSLRMKAKVPHSDVTTSNNHQQTKNHLNKSREDVHTQSSHSLTSESKQIETSTTKQNHHSKRKMTSNGKTLTLLDIFGCKQLLKQPKLKRQVLSRNISLRKKQRKDTKIVKPSLFQQRDLSFYIKGIKSSPITPSYLSNHNNAEWIRIPFPIPRAWSSPILSYSTNFPDNQTSHYFEFTLDKIDWQHLERLGPFYAILMDPPLVSIKLQDSLPKGFITMDDLCWLKFSSQLIPKGFLFVWIEKENIAKFIHFAKKWKFHYVENLVWLKRNVNNTFSEKSYNFFSKSKLTLLILRKGGEMELRHQRNPDVVDGFVLHNKDDVEGNRENKPTEYIYHMIETLLPEANYNKKTKKGHFLELWAERNSGRKGWTHVFVIPSDRKSFIPYENRFPETSEWLSKIPKSYKETRLEPETSTTLKTTNKENSIQQTTLNNNNDQEEKNLGHESDADSEVFEMMESQHMTNFLKKQQEDSKLHSSYFQKSDDEGEETVDERSELRDFWEEDF